MQPTTHQSKPVAGIHVPEMHTRTRANTRTRRVGIVLHNVLQRTVVLCALCLWSHCYCNSNEFCAPLNVPVVSDVDAGNVNLVLIIAALRDVTRHATVL